MGSAKQNLRKAASLLKQGRPVEARALYQRILETYPANTEARKALSQIDRNATTGDQWELSYRSARKLFELGEFDAAVSNCRGAVDRFPNVYAIWELLGSAAQLAGDTQLAVVAFRRATEIRPEFGAAHYNLGTAHTLAGDIEEAIKVYQTATQLEPTHIDAKYNLGNSFAESNQHAAAIEAYREVIALKPEHPWAHNNLGNSLRRQGRLEEAAEAYKTALDLDTDNPDFCCNLAVVLTDLGRLGEASYLAHRALTLNPNRPEPWISLGALLTQEGKLETAERLTTSGLEIFPDCADLHSNLSVLMQAQGRLNEANQAVNRALDLNSSLAEGWRIAVNLSQFEIDSSKLEHLNNLWHGETLCEVQKCQIGFALYEALKRSELYADAFKYLKSASAIRKKHLQYRFEHDQVFFDRLRAAAEDSIEGASQEFSSSSSSPIFIVGMPRSGTTLVEQIVSNHSLATGLGELPYIKQIAVAGVTGNQQTPHSLVKQTREKYLSKIADLSIKTPFFIDKMPHNFQWLPLLCSAFPEAKFIHVFRDPAATCWSNYEKYFTARGLAYSYGLDDVARYYNLYVELMGEFSSQLAGRLYHLNYESLVENQELATQDLADYLELEIEDMMLSPHLNTRAVHTASSEQVREPVYKGSSKKWLAFSQYLDGAFENLKSFNPILSENNT